MTAIYRFSEFAWNGIRINNHPVGENHLNPSLAASSFPFQTYWQPLDQSNNDNMLFSGINTTMGGGSASFNKATMVMGHDIRLRGTPNGSILFFVCHTGVSADISSNPKMICVWKTGGALEIYDSTYTLVGTSSTLFANLDKIHIAFTQPTSAAATMTFKLYRIVGEVYTLVETLVTGTGDWTTNNTHSLVWLPHDVSVVVDLGENNNNTIDVGAGYAADTLITPGLYKVACRFALALGTHQSTNAILGWQDQAASIVAADIVTACNSFNCAGGVNTGYATTTALAGTSKKLSFTMPTLASKGFQRGSTILAYRPFNAMFMGATQATPTARSFIIYDGVLYATAEMTSLILVAAVGTLPHGRGFLYSANGPDAAILTEAKLDSVEVGFERVQDGTTSVSLDCCMDMTMYVYTPPAANVKIGAGFGVGTFID